TGFLLKGQKGIVTSLHGVIKYPDIWAGRHEVTGKYVPYGDLKIVKVNIERDLALVSSPAIDALPNDIGFEEVAIARASQNDEDAEKKNAERLQGLQVIGFPKAIFHHWRFPLGLARRKLTALSDILAELKEHYREFSDRRSPLVGEEVLALSGF